MRLQAWDRARNECGLRLCHWQTRDRNKAVPTNGDGRKKSAGAEIGGTFEGLS